MKFIKTFKLFESNTRLDWPKTKAQVQKMLFIYKDNIVNPKINDDLTVDADEVNLRNYDLPKGIDELIHLPVKFGIIKNDFDVFYVGLITLEGAPKQVGGDFMCSNNKLTSLEGAPDKVDGNFNSYGNELISLKGAPKQVGGDFICYENKLTSLEGAPQIVGGWFNCGDNKLTSLEGAPRIVGGGFKCDFNELTSLKGAPEKVGGDFSCGNNKLTTLKDSPDIVEDSFYCSDNELTTLEGAPEKVGGDFNCENNKLTTLKGSPRVVGGYFSVSNNLELTSANGAPNEIGDKFYYNKTKIKTVPQFRSKTKKKINWTSAAPVSIFDFSMSDGEYRVNPRPKKNTAGEYEIVYSSEEVFMNVKTDNKGIITHYVDDPDNYEDEDGYDRFGTIRPDGPIDESKI